MELSVIFPAYKSFESKSKISPSPNFKHTSSSIEKKPNIDVNVVIVNVRLLDVNDVNG